VTIAILITGAIIWFYWRVEILKFIFMVRGYELDFVSLFVPSIWAQKLELAKQFMHTAKEINYQEVTWDQMVMVTTYIGDYIKYPAFIILAGLGILVFMTNPLSRFKKVYSMKSLLEHEKPIWPYIIPVAKLDLLNTDIHKGPWAMAMNPMNFAKRNNLIVFEKKVSGIDRFQTKQAPTANINRDETRRLFAMQVGRYWSGPEALPIHARALYAIFCARVNGDRDSAAKLQEHIARSASGDKLNFAGTDDLLRKHKDNKLVIKLTKRHAFELTVMASLIELARQDGVLPTAEFIWLKPVDRRLWYLLNCVGRQTPFAEVAGAFAHWIAEKEFGKPLNVPMVEEAVNGLEIAVKEIIYKPDDED
jgi:intracellular multiplication protein IcmP